ncbi:MAG: TraB/GumN family protein [Lysobacteraceae bacterium]|nr:MAG: TraB/GumN family protein [Xanthomonadaceae bacterium]
MRPSKPFLLKSLLLAWLAATVFAVDADARRPGVGSGPPVPLLWKVSDADNSLYLLGSFHLLKPDDYPLSAEVDAAFADAESLVFEIPPAEMAAPELAMQMTRAAMRQDGRQLNSELPASTVAALDAWVVANARELQKIGLSPQVLQLFEPWFAALTITLTEMGKQGLDPSLGLDAHLSAQAARAGKPTDGLETGADQIRSLDGMDKVEQLQFLAEALSESKDARRETARLHSAWRAGDAALLWNGMAVDMKKQYPRLYQRINVARNDAWLPKLERRLSQPGTDDALVVVGALHLLGSDGVVEKLRAKGYRVERLCSACADGKRD